MAWLIHGALNPWGFSTGRHGERAHLAAATAGRFAQEPIIEYRATAHGGSAVNDYPNMI
jgi:hypothetical protein